jgi:hypothetical protein
MQLIRGSYFFILLMKYLPCLLGSCLGLASAAHAQAPFRFGPRVGLVRTSMRTADPYVAARTGVEAGIVGALQVGHFAFQPGVLYTQRGFTRRDIPLGGGAGPRITSTRLDYLSIPLQVAYSQHVNGRGFQVFAGPYLGVLLGGRNKITYGNSQETGRIVITNTHTVNIGYSSYLLPDYNAYARRLDLGGQVGVGYQLGGALVQLSYSLGLRNTNPAERYTVGGLTYDAERDSYRNRSFQASLSYLVGPRG